MGTALEVLYGEAADETAVQLARHVQEAGITKKAIRYLHQAGSRAVRVSASQEAIAHFTRTLELLEGLPETPERDQEELERYIASNRASDSQFRSCQSASMIRSGGPVKPSCREGGPFRFDLALVHSRLDVPQSGPRTCAEPDVGDVALRGRPQEAAARLARPLTYTLQ